ncbi:GH25 family lysozyme [Streptomyces sp. NPDC002851]
MLHGVDVSSHQSDYSTKGQDFVIVKATEGRSYINPRMTDQVKKARDAGCVVGFYHFLWPNNIEAQAEYFVSKAIEQKGDLLACDWERTSEGTYASNAQKDQFIKAVKKLRPSHRTILYTNRDFWLNIDRTSYAGDGLWIADYVTPGKPRIRAKWRFHQYTSTPLDKNVGDFESKAALREWAVIG